MVAAPLPSSISDFLDDPAVPDLDVKDPIPPPTLDDNQQYFVRCGRCNAAYTLTQDMIKPEGSRVKCEVCGHTWFQAANRLQVLGEGYVLKVRNSQGEGTKEAVSVHLRMCRCLTIHVLLLNRTTRMTSRRRCWIM